MKRLKLLIASIVATAALVVPTVAFTAPVYGQTEINQNLCDGINLGTGGSCPSETDEEPIYDIINTIIDVFSIVVGAVSVIMVIIGGLRYITSAGDSSNVTAAKNTILYAIVGLVIVIFAQTIVKFVVSQLSNGQ